MDVFLTLLFTVMAVYGLWRNLATLRDAWRSNRAAFLATMKLIAVYVAYCALGIGILLSGLDGPQPERRALGGTMFLLAWIFYGALWLARAAPRTRPIPAWIERYPGPADALLLTAGFAGIVMYLG